MARSTPRGATRTGVSAAAYTNSFAIACRTTLLFIDTATDRLLTTSDPNAGTVTEVGSLGVNAEAGSGYDIVTAADGTNTAFAVLTVGGATTLYTINLTSGAATATGAVTGLNSGETLRGISAALASPVAAPAQAEGSVLAVTETNKLISFQNATPQKLCTTAAIAGLQAGENVLGIDKRPADGALYALGSTGRIYTIDTTNATATLKSMLVAGYHGRYQPVHGARRQRLRRRLQSRAGSPASREQHRTEPAHQRRHRRHDDGRGAESCRLDRHCGQLHQ